MAILTDYILQHKPDGFLPQGRQQSLLWGRPSPANSFLRSAWWRATFETQNVLTPPSKRSWSACVSKNYFMEISCFICWFLTCPGLVLMSLQICALWLNVNCRGCMRIVFVCRVRVMLWYRYKTIQAKLLNHNLRISGWVYVGLVSHVKNNRSLYRVLSSSHVETLT